MDSLIGTLAFVGVVFWFYKLGKHTGSRKGYNVGLARGRRKRRGHRGNRR